MARISGIDIPNHKPIKVALTAVYGIGRKSAEDILTKAKVELNKRSKDLTSADIQAISQVLEKIPTEGDLRKIVRDNIQRLKRISSYRGSRHHQGLPTRGQRTKTNGRTNRGKRRTVGAMTKETRQKLETATAPKK